MEVFLLAGFSPLWAAGAVRRSGAWGAVLGGLAGGILATPLLQLIGVIQVVVWAWWSLRGAGIL